MLTRKYTRPPRPATVRPTRWRVPAMISDECHCAPKSKPHRNPALLEMARGKPCLLQIPGVCQGGTDTTVACHSNLSIHGKAARRKADDEYSAWGCAACHRWLDQGPAHADVKNLAFQGAHLRQVPEWRAIRAGIVAATPRERRAAAWALDLLEATP